MTDTASNFPSGAPVDPKGNLTPQWRLFFLSLFNRTGGTSGNDSAALLLLIQGLQQALDALIAGLDGDILSIEPVIPPPVDMGSQIAVLGIAVQQAFASIGALQQEMPSYGDVFTSAPADQMSEMASARLMPLNDAVTEMVFPPQSTDLTAQAPNSVTPTASPFKYTATFRQALHFTGGTVSALSYSRGATSLALGLISGGGQIVELSNGDAVTITYSAAPTITVIPR